MYLKRLSSSAAIVSILAGQGVLLAYSVGWLTAQGYLPALPVIAASSFGYLLVHLLRGYRFELPRLDLRVLWPGLALAGVFLLAMDFWNWGKSGPLWLGLPYWIWYSVGLSALQMVIVLWMLRRATDTNAADVIQPQ